MVYLQFNLSAVRERFNDDTQTSTVSPLSGRLLTILVKGHIDK